MNLTLAELLVALIGTSTATAFVTGWLARRKTGGEASERFASAAGMVAGQNEQLLIEIKRLRADLVDAYLEIKNLKAEVANLRLALGKQIHNQE